MLLRQSKAKIGKKSSRLGHWCPKLSLGFLVGSQEGKSVLHGHGIILVLNLCTFFMCPSIALVTPSPPVSFLRTSRRLNNINNEFPEQVFHRFCSCDVLTVFFESCCKLLAYFKGINWVSLNHLLTINWKSLQLLKLSV